MSDVPVAAVARSLRSAGVLSSLDWHFAKSLASLSDGTSDAVVLATALVSRAVAQGHVCLDLGGLIEQSVLRDQDDQPLAVDWPDREEWVEELRRSALVGTVVPGEKADEVAAPLVLEGQRLYTRRYWLYERELAANLNARSVDVVPALGAAEVLACVERLFGPTPEEADLQRVAAVVALTRRLCVVMGGPGTGKTSTVANLLVLLAEDERCRRGRLPDLLVLAPTGKAANRLSQSLAESAARLACDEEIRDLVAAKAATIHRALGRDPRSRTRFRHDAQRPLSADVVVVDEASMVDIALMAKLLAAVPLHARVVLLGDRDQLASVEAGAILSDLCGGRDGEGYSSEAASRIEKLSGVVVPTKGSLPLISDGIVHLRRNYRYRESSAIGLLAAAIKAGDEDAVLGILGGDEHGSVALRPCLDADAQLYDEALGAIRPLFGDAAPVEKLRSLSKFRILCALRRGSLGVEGLNRQIETRARGIGWIEGDAENYPGRPVMVLRNDRESELFNGDVGVLLGDESGDLHAFFPVGEEARAVSMGRLPSYETVYAMTIHKSQGSEFDEVAIVLPDRPSPLLTRELLYTAVTRAKSKVVIHADPEVVRLAVRQRVERSSGLAGRLGWR